VECTVDNASSSLDLVLQELVKVISVCYVKDLRLKFKCEYFYTISDLKVLKTDKVKFTGLLWEPATGPKHVAGIIT
jgi:hypothetical protein